jgi:hypothetical protein
MFVNPPLRDVRGSVDTGWLSIGLSNQLLASVGILRSPR